ncbi:sensor histidine kinase [Paenibacillus sp. J5C_2022]|uniref:cache domain-containing sensor histidine kinase n=1 Tax=Paenibacillus sp. J5C2022 TaxID=2977129 RepID=UPI0021D134E1|nr:sensor histidine kinase [Paenibacillus sp. J5C2022]MCU6712938.1 sensor histidine kinase [Paenibacillus sp. J5C2022]
MGVAAAFNRLRSKIFISTVLFVIIPTIVAFLLLNRTLEMKIEEKVGAASQGALDLAVKNMGGMLENMMTSITVIMLDPDMIRLLKQPDQMDAYEKHQVVDSTIRSLKSTYLFNMDSQLTLLDWRGHVYTSWYTKGRTYDDFAAEAWFEQLSASKASFIWMDSFQYETEYDGVPMLSVARLIQTPADFESYGIAVVSVPEEELWSISEGIAGEMIIVDSEGHVITGGNNNGHELNQHVTNDAFLRDISNQDHGQTVAEWNGTKMMINYNTIDITGWKAVQLIPYDEVFAEIYSVRKLSIVIAAAIFLLFIGIGFSIADRVSKPLGLLQKKMRKTGNGEFAIINSIKGTVEISDLIGTYNTMIGNMKSLLAKVKDEHEQKEQMRFKALQAQINPHFILNTLNNIKWMAFMRDDREVGEMISCLAALMEESIGRGNDIISIRQEIRYIENFMQLQKIKYNERITVNYDIPEPLLDGLTIKFMLQPIVENCIYHGMKKTKNKCRIEIRARQEADAVGFIISDNGAGMSRDRLKEVRTMLYEGSAVAGPKHIGLKNVHDRIQLSFGAAYGVTIDSQENSGTEVSVKIPYQKCEEEERLC